MAGLNSSNDSEYSEDIKKSEADLYNELTTGFAQEYIPQLRGAEKNDLIRDIMLTEQIKGSNIGNNLEQHMLKYDQFSGLDISKISIHKLRKEFVGNFTTRKNREEIIRESILKDYDISPEEYDRKVAKAIERLEDEEIKGLLKDDEGKVRYLTKLESARYKKLKEIFGRAPNMKKKTSILDSISQEESAKRLNKMTEQEQRLVLEVLERAKYSKYLGATDMKILIESKYFTSGEVKELVRTFIPQISLQKAVDLQIIQPAKADNIKDEYVKKYLKEHNVNVDQDTKDKLYATLHLGEIMISTYDFSTQDLHKISSKVGFTNFERDIERMKKEIEEEIRQKGPQSLDSLKQGIVGLGLPHLQGFEKLQEGAILEYNMSREGEPYKQYVRIQSINEEKKEFGYTLCGEGAVNLKASGETLFVSYGQYLETLKKERNTVKVMTQDNVKQHVKSGEIEASDFQSFSESDFSGIENAPKRQNVLARKKELLQEQVESTQDELGKNPNSNLLKSRLKAQQEELEKLDGSTDIQAKEAAKEATFLNFLDKLNDVDSEGKVIGFEKGIYIETEQNAFCVDGFDIEKEQIVLNGLKNSFEPVSFSDFIQAFKKQKAKRTKSLDSVGALIERVQGTQEWGKIEYKGGKLVEKGVEHKGQNEEQHIQYLSSDDSDVIVKILDIQDGFVELQRGEQEDIKEKKGKQEVEGKKLKIKGAQKEVYSLNEFARFVESEKLKTDWQLGKTGLEIHPDELENKRSAGGGIMGFFAGNMTIMDIVQGGQMIPELVQEYWKKGSDIRSAKAAVAMGKFLPKEMQEELLIKVERAESESMDKALEDLKKVDSPIAVGRIRDWLLDKNTPEHNKEAGLLFMLEKYGHLCAKDELYPYRGKFLWYEAFGGRINDELFLSVKAEAEADNQIFSEETLMWILMKKQCKGGHYSGIKRRSRLHKEFEAKFKSGVEEEFEKGYKDASSKRTAKKMIKEGMGEAMGGTTTNALGWMKKAVERGGPLEDMMEISFCLLYSGAVYDFDQASYLKAKSLWDGDGQPIISQRFISSRPEMDLFNSTVFELSKEIQEQYPNRFPSIASEAKKIFDNAQNTNRKNNSEKARLQAAQDFWHKYGKVLSRGLNMSLGSDGEFAKTDNIIREKKGENSTFAKYCEQVEGYVEENGEVFKEGFMEDAAGETGIFGMHLSKMAEKFLAQHQGGGFKKPIAGKRVWTQMYRDIEGTPKKVFIGDSIDSLGNKERQVNYIVDRLEKISAGILAAHGSRTGILSAFNSPTSSLGEKFNAWGINFASELSSISADQIKKGGKRKYFEAAAQRIISGATNVGALGSSDPVTQHMDDTKSKASKVAGKTVDPSDPEGPNGFPD